jgi:hypothetical protein
LLLRGVPLAAAALDRLRHDVTERGAAVSRMRADVGAVGALTDSAAVARRRLVALAPRILNGGTEAEAVADLIGRMGVLATANATALARSEPLPDSTRIGWLRRVSVRVVLESDLRGVLETLNAMSHGSAVIVLRSVRLTAADPASTDAAPEVISAEATVTGWYLLRKADR